MNPVALALVLVAATVHATWNLLSKQASASTGVAFIWLTSATASLLYAPAVAITLLVDPFRIGPVQVLFLVGTAVIHVGYFLLLQAGYRRADLSIVYPLARGTGPMLASAVAIVALGERPTSLGLVGISLIVAGLFVLGARSGALRAREGRLGVVFGLATGVLIGVYTLWDAHAVQALGIPPLVEDWSSNAGCLFLLSPVAWTQRAEVARVRHRYSRQVLGAGALIPLAYILVLAAFVVAPITAVAPVREVSVVIGVLFGGKLLSEGELPRRLAGAGVISAGVVVIALG